jgi:predicted N-formylglutamate amidohydrolase
MTLTEAPNLTAPAAMFGPLHAPSPLVLTCDHATNAIPPPLRASAADLPWLDTHWGYDLGAAALTKRLVTRLAAPAVASTSSRLVADPNRDPSRDHDWIPTHVEGHPLSFNQALDAPERARRRLTLHEPYHRAIDALLAMAREAHPSAPPVALLAVHSFTPEYPGSAPRPMHAGVMFDAHAPSAVAASSMAAALSALGIPTALNAPYSGLDGPFYAMQRHGPAHGLRYVQLEVRQDLLATDADLDAIADAVARAVTAAFDLPPR